MSHDTAVAQAPAPFTATDSMALVVLFNGDYLAMEHHTATVNPDDLYANIAAHHLSRQGIIEVTDLQADTVRLTALGKARLAATQRAQEAA